MASEEKIKDIFSDDRLYEAYKNAETADKKFKILNDAMAERNYFNAKHLNLFHLGEKVTYAKKGFWGNYGNVEFIIEKDNSGKVSNMEASYNFANHWWTHLFVDVIGWYARYY